MNRAVTNERARVGHVALAALVLGVLRRVEDVVGQLELELAGEVLDRRDVGEDLGDTLLEEPLEGLALHRDEIGQLRAPRAAWRRKDVRGTREKPTSLLRAQREGNSEL